MRSMPPACWSRCSWRCSAPGSRRAGTTCECVNTNEPGAARAAEQPRLVSRARCTPRSRRDRARGSPPYFISKMIHEQKRRRAQRPRHARTRLQDSRTRNSRSTQGPVKPRRRPNELSMSYRNPSASPTTVRSRSGKARSVSSLCDDDRDGPLCRSKPDSASRSHNRWAAGDGSSLAPQQTQVVKIDPNSPYKTPNPNAGTRQQSSPAKRQTIFKASRAQALAEPQYRPGLHAGINTISPLEWRTRHLRALHMLASRSTDADGRARTGICRDRATLGDG